MIISIETSWGISKALNAEYIMHNNESLPAAMLIVKTKYNSYELINVLYIKWDKLDLI